MGRKKAKIVIYDQMRENGGTNYRVTWATLGSQDSVIYINKSGLFILFSEFFLMFFGHFARIYHLNQIQIRIAFRAIFNLKRDVDIRSGHHLIKEWSVFTTISFTVFSVSMKFLDYYQLWVF